MSKWKILVGVIANENFIITIFFNFKKLVIQTFIDISRN